MKKICAMVLALCMILSLAGCGGTSGASASAPTADTSVDTSASAETETVTLTFMRTGTPEILHEIFDPMIEEFEKEYPNIKIDMQDLGWSDAEKTLQTMAASETLPDVMYHLPGTIFDLADKGLVLDLTSYVDDELKNDMYPAMLQAGQYDGKQYMITCGGSTIMLWYNTELFEQAGLDPENPPKTWDEFKAACEALSKIDGIAPFGPVSYTHLDVYKRQIYIYAALAPVPIAAFGSSETAATGKAFLKGYVGVCLQGAVIVLSCLIFSAYMGSGSPAAPSGSAVSMVWTYVTEIIFNMLVLVGLVKSSDRIVREMMGLRGMRASLASCNLSASRTQRS